MGFTWKELGSYFIGVTGIVYNKFICFCAGLTDIFALAIVVVTFFFITIPHAVEIMENRKEKKKE